MGVMSDLHLLSQQVREKVNDGVDRDRAIHLVARRTVYGVDQIRWAYNERFE